MARTCTEGERKHQQNSIYHTQFQPLNSTRFYTRFTSITTSGFTVGTSILQNIQNVVLQASWTTDAGGSCTLSSCSPANTQHSQKEQDTNHHHDYGKCNTSTQKPSTKGTDFLMKMYRRSTFCSRNCKSSAPSILSVLANTAPSRRVVNGAGL